MLTKSNLLKRIRLLFLEAHIKDTMGNSLKDIMLEVSGYNSEEINPTLDGLIEVIKEMQHNDFSSGIPSSLFELGLSCAIPDSQTTYDTTLRIPEDGEDIVKEINVLRTLFKEERKIAVLQNRLFQNAMKIRKDYAGIEDVNDFLNKTVELIEENNPTKSDSSAIIDKVSLSNSSDIKEVLDKVKEESTDSGVWKTYLTGLNDMTQGGIRNGLTFILGSQHNFKSGLTLSIFCSAALLNPPKPSERPGKPTMVWISFEDPMVKLMGDVYGILKGYDDPDGERIELGDLDTEEESEYIRKKFEATGYDVEFYRIDPSNYSFTALFNFLTDLEIKGASLRFIGLDYLAHIPKTGCSDRGATGADTRELVRRVRNWMEARGIPCLSPHQISAGGNNLKRDGIDDAEFVAKVVDKGYTADSSQINQEYDLELTVNKHMIGKDTYLNVGRGKHKLNSVLANQEHLFFHVKFPLNGNKIPPDVLEGQTRKCYATVEEIKEASVGTIF